MFFGFFKKKKLENEIEKLKATFKNSFLNVKDDLNKVSIWINYLNEKNKNFDEKIEELNSKINELDKEIKEIKEILFISQKVFKQVFKHQTAVQTPVQISTAVQTPVQTAKNAILENLTLMERAILWVLANTDLKLSCEDIARVLGKSENTIRGQLNSLKSKWPQLINEIIEKNGKKRYYIDDKVKEFLFKKIKSESKKERKKIKKVRFNI